MESLMPSEKNQTSLGNNRPLTRLCATLPLLPWAHILTLASASKGSPPNMNVGCQPGTTQEEEVALAPPRAAS